MPSGSAPTEGTVISTMGLAPQRAARVADKMQARDNRAARSTAAGESLLMNRARLSIWATRRVIRVRRTASEFVFCEQRVINFSFINLARVREAGNMAA